MLGTGAVTQSFLAESFSEAMQRTGIKVIRTFSTSLAASSPVIFGVIGDCGYFDQGYIVLADILSVVIGFNFRISRQITHSNPSVGSRIGFNPHTHIYIHMI